MTSYIPDQLDQLSKKELLEVAQIMHETNVDLNAQLAKANERVRERSEELVNRHNQIQELRQENGEYAILIANLVRRADVKTDLLQNPTFEKASEQLNKFAIENKVEALEFILGRVEPVTVSHAVKDHIVYYIKQLRKEQE